MEVPKRRILRNTVRFFSYTIGIVLILVISAVVGALFFRTSVAAAASTVLRPSFCLGGWSHPQNASGEAELSVSDPESSYSTNNSAFLESSVAAQLFCGYFTSQEKSNPPSHIVIQFLWSMKQNVPPPSVQPVESLSSDSGFLVATSTGFIVPSPTASSTDTGSSSTKPEPTPGAPESSETTPAPVSTPQSGGNSASTEQSAPAQTQMEPTAPPVAPSAPPSSEPSARAILHSLFSTIVSTAEAQTDQSVSSSPIFDISYSVDGVRWNSIGSVGLDNWKEYKVAVPITSWEDVNKLQIMVNTVPVVDKKPDVYLESMSARISYKQTAGEALSDLLSSAADAIGDLTDAITDTVKPEPKIDLPVEQPKVAQTVTITKRKVSFSLAGSPIERTDSATSSAGRTIAPNNSIKVEASANDSLGVSGSCAEKYFVILLYKTSDAYKLKQSSFVANEARECLGGSFSYDLSNLPGEIRDGSYFLLVGSEDETNPWLPSSRLYPISVTSTTTTETIEQ